MKELNLLKLYPKKDQSRSKVSNERSVVHRIVAGDRDFDFFDGDRSYGYGGLKQDFRWEPIARDICATLGLKKNARVLQINCEKGFLLHAFSNHIESNQIVGTESSEYALVHSYSRDEYSLVKSKLPRLVFKSNSFDLVISLGNVYTLSLKDALNHLTEIERVKKFHSYVTLATYENEEQYFLFKKWSLLANLILKRSEWLDLMKMAGYSGYYSFIDSKYLGLE